MGIFHKEETHESRSSSMSYALRWKQLNIRQVALVGVLTIAVIIIILIWLYGQQNKQISLVIDGNVQSVETREDSVADLLDEQAINLHPKDTLSRPLGSVLTDGDRVVIVRAVPVKVSVDGETKTTFTTKEKVKDVLDELGVTLNQDDKVTPALDRKLDADAGITIVRVSKHLVQTEEAVPFSVVKTSDKELLKGTTKVVQPGSEGMVIHNIEKTYEDGIFVTKRWLGKEVSKEAQPKVVAVGTKEPTAVLSASISRSANTVNIGGNATKNGVSFKYKKVLKNVTLTAYSSEQEGIGTRTASGTRVTEGRTIAVDKSVVPLGWWVYIEGIGFRKAEDTGGAIKGNKMDVYYDSLKTAKNFGRKKGRTVYVIGPTKPELN
ncbi:3D domain-containing protein [Paenibacillus senegalimassiliensis]|uniref:3D domain-containing protein n=1 Tax=Paenibacillus senegalimassiliensis TaxID=1737426 RepID=UPI00073FA2FA|nr:3D domain-containing protein [Paenibacillus senegalimassiliensis]